MKKRLEEILKENLTDFPYWSEAGKEDFINTLIRVFRDAVPDEQTKELSIVYHERNNYRANYERGWNACRAEMLRKMEEQ